jgi:hypothetical protein
MSSDRVEPPFDSRHVWPTPSVAIEHDACAVCLGGGETFDIVLGRVGLCSGCGGTGALADMLARQCDDPDCPEHGRGEH